MIGESQISSNQDMADIPLEHKLEEESNSKEQLVFSEVEGSEERLRIVRSKWSGVKAIQYNE